MRIDVSQPVAAPQALVFRHLADFDRLAGRVGSGAVAIHGREPQWTARVHLHGVERTGHLRLARLDAPSFYAVEGGIEGVAAVLAVKVAPDGPDQSRIDLALEARPASLRGRLILQTLRLMQHRLTERLAARLAAFAREIEDAWR
ncbi:MAG: SRPBCC family protein [Rhodobacteraceae bacterium]|nr:SRPBCC family protein [Paracoccaceae bacterium]